MGKQEINHDLKDEQLLKDFGRELHRAMQECNITAAELADEVNVARTSVNSWVSGKSQINFTALRNILRTLHYHHEYDISRLLRVVSVTGRHAVKRTPQRK